MDGNELSLRDLGMGEEESLGFLEGMILGGYLNLVVLGFPGMASM